MRIAMLVSDTGVCGAAVHCVNLTRFLLQQGHEVLLVHRPGSWSSHDCTLAAERLETSFSRTPKELIRVARRLSEFAPDVMHTHMSSAHSYGMLARIFAPVPIVATAHSLHLQLHWAFNHKVIATSYEAQDYHRRYNRVRAHALCVIPNFVDTREFKPPSEQERLAARKALNLPPDAYVVGNIGQLIDRKKPADLIFGFARLMREKPDSFLVLQGAHEARLAHEVRALIRQLGLTSRVILAGETADVRQTLAAMDVFALTSKQETGPVAVLEAMAMELPVVATPVGMVPEFVEHSITGYHVKIGDTDELGGRLVELARDVSLRQSLGAAARARALQRFSIEQIAPSIERVLLAATSIACRPALGVIGRRMVS
jgi:glycosyltransferase involved in cell wall biosynthesis